MSIEERKAKLMSVIIDSKDDELIRMLEEDVRLHHMQAAKNPHNLSDEEWAELQEMMEEPAEKDTISLNEFSEEVAKWRRGIF